MTTVTMIAPAGFSGTISVNRSTPPSSGNTYTPDANGLIAADTRDVGFLLGVGFRFYRVAVQRCCIRAPAVADLISVVGAVTPTNVALTIAAQPPQPRKLAVRIVIGTTTTTAITAGTLTLVGVDTDGNAITEVISLIKTASATVKTANAYASLTSATVAGYVASGSGTGNTIGIGLAADLGVPTQPGAVNFTLLKATKIVSTFTGSGTAVTTAAVVPADDVTSTATVDATARTVSPTTAPGATTTTSTDFEFTYSYGLAD